ncbi:molybdopterin-dependent oxidoreductase [Lutimaribacter sp. EGI FJ00015]|uniref:Molybdopterin-dependent oxidoreductase n=1 Tax=Lutimaribacter degradans TaxID=2945989 RepID=A0ACC5ZRM1_9RHOB|nr:molybdopterin cofactor-binding domain-containing protein [Lutimaribacter sp. EGI FJ00013]MCM2560818.1 molybdopterin-dependent oxidoreductase [Lutimaribacter sp. EGI FJ00013]MCO0612237.1 molybdopterin-dependent oxidoreductase [Lutimaribacter sp. EGI FJ00015]MCO0634643.1 molybdopterin-dependent oxidoreductase [Lutimaribacter sp. EGI FJ00014]
MASLGKIARRTFLIGSAAIVGGAAFGAWYVGRPAPNPLMPGRGEAALTPFVLVTDDGVTLITPRAEMGQGTQTTLAALLAEELDLDWQDVRVEHGPPATAYYNGALMGEALPGKGYDQSDFMHGLAETIGKVGKVFDMQVTGGSTAMKDGYTRLRVAGATAREALKWAAAERLGVDAAELRTEKGTVIAPDGTVIAYTDLAAEAAEAPLRAPDLRDPADWKYLGKSMPRLDMVGKATGTAAFGIDARPEGLRFAALRINPKRAGMRSFDASTAEGMAGVERVIELRDGVAVVARNTWLAQQAVDAIEVEWEDAPYPADTDKIFQRIADAFDGSANSTMRDDGDAGTLPGGATEVTAEYTLPYLAHATMEPMNATALYTGDTLTVWAGNQAPTFTRDHCATAAGLEPDQVTVITPYLGGGFGRRGELDFSVYATQVAVAMQGTPVQLTWSREEDMRHDFYRPGAMARMRGAVRDGTAVLLDAQVAAQSTTQQAMGRWLGMSPGGPDKGHVDGLFNAPYAIANHRVRGYLADLDVPVGFWRSVGASFNAFFQDCFMDEMAHAAGADPLEFRLALMRDEYPAGAGVLEAVRDMSGWAGEKPGNTGRGVAFSYSFGTPVAQVVEVVDEDGTIRIAHVWIACDVGTALDPGIIEAQMIGGCIYGLSAAVSEEITFAEGEAEQYNFPDYDALRMHNTPDFTVQILENNAHLGGVGEPGTPPAAPALANALFDLTGTRARRLPLNKSFDLLV